MDAPAPPSGCSYERDGDSSFVTLKPALSDVKWDEIESIGNAIETRLEQDKPKKVVFDISPLTYMGSAMVALVVRWWKTVGKVGGKSVVVCNDENVMEVLRLAALDKHWTIVSSRSQAHEKLGIRAAAASGMMPVMGGDAPPGGSDSAGSSAVSGSGPMLPLVVGGVGLLVGLIGAVLFLVRAGDPRVGLGLALAGGLTGLIAGVLAAIVCTGSRRGAGVAIAVFGAIIAGLGGYRLADDADPAPRPAAPAEKADAVTPSAAGATDAANAAGSAGVAPTPTPTATQTPAGSATRPDETPRLAPGEAADDAGGPSDDASDNGGELNAVEEVPVGGSR